MRHVARKGPFDSRGTGRIRQHVGIHLVNRGVSNQNANRMLDEGEGVVSIQLVARLFGLVRHAMIVYNVVRAIATEVNQVSPCRTVRNLEALRAARSNAFQAIEGLMLEEEPKLRVRRRCAVLDDHRLVLGKPHAHAESRCTVGIRRGVLSATDRRAIAHHAVDGIIGAEARTISIAHLDTLPRAAAKQLEEKSLARGVVPTKRPLRALAVNGEIVERGIIEIAAVVEPVVVEHVDTVRGLTSHGIAAERLENRRILTASPHLDVVTHLDNAIALVGSFRPRKVKRPRTQMHRAALLRGVVNRLLKKRRIVRGFFLPLPQGNHVEERGRLLGACALARLRARGHDAGGGSRSCASEGSDERAAGEGARHAATPCFPPGRSLQGSARRTEVSRMRESRRASHRAKAADVPFSVQRREARC